jgi:hypothetical protein
MGNEGNTREGSPGLFWTIFSGACAAEIAFLYVAIFGH